MSVTMYMVNESVRRRERGHPDAHDRRELGGQAAQQGEHARPRDRVEHDHELAAALAQQAPRRRLHSQTPASRRATRPRTSFMSCFRSRTASRIPLSDAMTLSQTASVGPRTCAASWIKGRSSFIIRHLRPRARTWRRALWILLFFYLSHMTRY